MKPQEIVTRAFKVYPTTDQAAKYECAAILKDSTFSEIDRAECQFATTETIPDNGTQIPSDIGPKKGGLNGIFAAIKEMWKNFWGSFSDFITGKSCRSKCSGFFDFSCNIQYICLSWIAMSCLLLLIFPAVTVLVWLLHQKGLFDPLYDWWDDHFAVSTTDRVYRKTQLLPKLYHVNKHDSHFERDHKERRKLHKRRSTDKYHVKHDHHRLHDHNQRHNYKNSSDYVWQGYSSSRKDKLHRKPKRDSLLDDKSGYLKTQMERQSTRGTLRNPRMYEVLEDQLRRQKHEKKREHLHSKNNANGLSRVR